MPEYSPEPWRVVYDEYEQRNEIARGEPRTSGDNPGWDASERVLALKVLPLTADADRIVACVNAMAGVPTEELPAAGALIRRLQQMPVKVFAHDPEEQPMADILTMWLNRLKEDQDA